ncbi:MAG: hypothetical protein ABIP51_22520 [Bacteroidia bacterium]
MKKLILITATFLSFTVVLAQKNTATPGTNNGVNSNTQSDMGTIQTPSIITNHFDIDYPNNTAIWYKDGSNYRAEYSDSKSNIGRSATYDKNGVRIGTEEQLSSGNYPTEISDYYTKKYPNEEYQVWSSKDGMGNTTYYTTHNNETLWYDKAGKFTSKTKKKSYSTKPQK